MKNNNNPKQYDCILSADGKRYSVSALVNKVRSLAEWYARNWGHSMREEDVEEVVGEVNLLIAMYFTQKYDSTKSPVEAWLRRIVFHEGSDMLRKIISKDNFLRNAKDSFVEEPYSEGVESELIAKETRKEWNRYLSSVDEQKRSCMQMHYEGYKSGEIAEKLGISDDKVYRTVCREKKALKKKLDLE